MTDPIVTNYAGGVPGAAIAFGQPGATAIAVDAAHPLPVATVMASASSTPLTGTLSANGTAGPFVPQTGRPIWLTLSGTWTGSVTVQRSTDGGATRLPLTVAGQAWGVFSGNVNEPVLEESDAAASLYLAVTVASGTLGYRVAQ